MNSQGIQYSTVEEQLQKLKSHNLIIEDEEEALNLLKIHGYSNIIKSYREPYFISGFSSKYHNNVSFKQIFSLYTFDRELRGAVVSSMLDLEEIVKESLSDILASQFGITENEYLKFSNFRSKKRENPNFSLKKILANIRSKLDLKSNPIYHYSKKYRYVPPWVLFKHIYLSDTVNLINHLKPIEQRLLVHSLLDLEEPAISKYTIDELRQILIDILFICLEFRNLTAHGGRLYNYVSKAKLRVLSENLPTKNPDGRVIFSELIFYLGLFKEKTPFLRLKYFLDNEVSRHCSKYPNDITYLRNQLNIDIQENNIAWYSPNSRSKKYHFHRFCSGLSNATPLDIKELKNNGYSPCKKCAIKR